MSSTLATQPSERDALIDLPPIPPAYVEVLPGPSAGMPEEIIIAAKGGGDHEPPGHHHDHGDEGPRPSRIGPSGIPSGEAIGTPTLS